MHSKKNLFGYLCIVVCGSILSVYLYTLFASLFSVYEKSFDVTVYIYGVALSKIFAVLAIALIIILAMIISSLRAKNVIRPLKINATFSLIAYYVTFCLLIAGGMFLRVKSLIDSKSFFDNSLYLNWKNDCFMPEGNIFERAFLGLTGFFFRTFGEVYFIPHILNICFYLAAVVLVVSFIRAYLGKFEAICVLSVMMLFERFFDLSTDFSGTTLVLLTVAAIIFTLTYFLEDVFLKKPVLVNTIICIATLSLIVLYHFFVRAFSVGTLYIPSPRFYDGSSYYGCLFAIGICSLLGVVSYFYEKNSKVLMPAIVLLLIFIAGLFSMETEQKFLYLYPFLASIAGCGIKWFIFGGNCEEAEGCEEPAEVLAEENLKVEEVSLEDLSEDTVTETEPDTVATKEALTEEEVLAEEIILLEDEDLPKEEMAASEEIHKVEQTKAMELLKDENVKAETEVSEPETINLPKKVKLLDNPIPIPKRNSKKKIDYAFEPAARLMKFDIEIKDSDDFDIK